MNWNGIGVNWNGIGVNFILIIILILKNKMGIFLQNLTLTLSSNYNKVIKPIPLR